jgi:hypothetical protein
VWLAVTINKQLQFSMSAERALQILRDEATKLFQSRAIRNLTQVDRRLSVVFVGFENGRPLIALLSNFESPNDPQNKLRDDFSLWIRRPSDESLAIALGNNTSVQKKDIEVFSHLMDEDKPLQALIAKARDTVLKAAVDPRSNGTIGSNVLHGVIPADNGKSAQSAYISKIGSDEYLVIPILTPQAPIAISAIKLHLTAPTPPRPHRNAPCTCGSNRKFKNCCGIVR